MFEQLEEKELDPVINELIAHFTVLYSNPNETDRQKSHNRVQSIVSCSYYIEVLLKVIQNPTLNGSLMLMKITVRWQLRFPSTTKQRQDLHERIRYR